MILSLCCTFRNLQNTVALTKMLVCERDRYDRRSQDAQRVKQNISILYFVDRASRYNSLLMINLTHFFISLFITLLYMFRASQGLLSGDRVVLTHHLV